MDKKILDSLRECCEQHFTAGTCQAFFLEDSMHIDCQSGQWQERFPFCDELHDEVLLNYAESKRKLDLALFFSLR
jgi:hypothetical protein